VSTWNEHRVTFSLEGRASNDVYNVNELTMPDLDM
jgi:hypothetical protein